jgi:hypothetical protein
VPLVIALVIVFAVLLFSWVAIAREPGPGPADVALAYERAWDELDFSLLYDLSGPELRDGMRRDEFIAAKRAAYTRADVTQRIGSHVTIDTSISGHQAALVVTRVEANGGFVRNNVTLEHGSNGWTVVGYALRPDSEAGASNAQ